MLILLSKPPQVRQTLIESLLELVIKLALIDVVLVAYQHLSLNFDVFDHILRHILIKHIRQLFDQVI